MLSYKEVIEIANELSNIDEMYDMVFNTTDLAFKEGRFNYVDLGLQQLDIKSLKLKTLNALFTITRLAKDKLPSREKAMEEYGVKLKLESSISSYTEKLRRYNRLK